MSLSLPAVEDAPGGAIPTPDPAEVSEMNVTIEDVTNNPEAQANLEMSSEHHIAEPQVGELNCLTHCLTIVLSRQSQFKQRSPKSNSGFIGLV